MAEATTRFEPAEGRRLRKAIKEAFENDRKIRFADVAYERTSEIPEGRLLLSAQSSGRVRGAYLIVEEYLSLQRMLHLLEHGGLEDEVLRVRRGLLDLLARQEEGAPEENVDVSQYFRKPPPAPKAEPPTWTASGDELPMTPNEYLRLHGWTGYLDVEVAQEKRRMSEAGEEDWLFADGGFRYSYPRLGMKGVRPNEALGLQLIGDARDLGGFRELMEVLNEAKERCADEPGVA